MVSVNPNPTTAHQQGIYLFDPMKGMGLQGLNPPPPQPPPPANSTASGGGGGEVGQVQEDPNKKVRKPYTITKSRESWTEQEHDKFLEALQLFDRDWKKIEAFVGSKTVIQIRSHAQKYFLKVQKNGTSEHVPPPRPKRKASHPYPQKAPKIAPVASQIAFRSSSPLVDPMYVVRPDTVSVHGNPGTSGALASWSYSSAPAVSVPPVNRDDTGMAAPIVQNNSYSSSNESTPKYWPRSHTFGQGDHEKSIRVMPDFAQVYSFIGSVFDPNASGHLQRLKQMDPINLETALLLMRNLCVNLTSPEFEDHRRLLAAYDFNSEKAKSSRPFDFCADNAILST